MTPLGASEHPAGAHAVSSVPLVVDLDGTLVKTDLLVESALRLLKANPLYLFLLPVWLLLGRSVLKDQIARRVRLDPALLPYNEELVAYLRREHARDRKVVLATASSARLAHAVGGFVGVFADVIASDHKTNLAGRRKRDALVSRYGARGFDYAGNAGADLPIWRCARKAIIVNPSLRVCASASRLSNIERTFAARSSVARALLRSLRVHQWLKNLLVFAPVIAAHAWSDLSAVVHATILWCAFSLIASAVYQVNDIVDLDHDRSHPTKRHRPLAAGELPIAMAVAAVALLVPAGAALALLLSPKACAVLAVYVVATCAYSFALKKRVLIDVVLLACLYTTRIVAGAAAIDVSPSYWLLTFSMFTFLSLALLKRCAELGESARNGGPAPAGRGYRIEDLPYLTSFGSALAAGAVVVLALYINDTASAEHYSIPQLLWALCPLLVYWIGRMWIKTGRGEMHEDPIVFAARDKPSLITTGVALMLVLAAA